MNMIGFRLESIDDRWVEQEYREVHHIHSLDMLPPVAEFQIPEDWLLPRMDVPFTEPDIYERVLSQTWAKCVLMMSDDFHMSAPVNDVKRHEDKETVKLSDILPHDPVYVVTSGPEICKRVTKKEDLKYNTCNHCGTDKTSLWRRRENRTVCNACALYEKLHGVPRPAHLLNQTIRKRNRADSAHRKRS